MDNLTPEQQEEYQRKLNEMYAQALNELGNNLPQVNVKEARETPFVKPGNYDMNNPIEAAQYQTQNDVNDFRANRALGDEEMWRQAMENGNILHEGGPSYNSVYPGPRDLPEESWRRNLVEDQYIPSGNAAPVPNYETNRVLPPHIQNWYDNDERERQWMNRDAGLDLLGRLAGRGL